MGAPFALNASLSRFFSSRWTDLAASRLHGEARRDLERRGHRLEPPALGVFGRGTGPVRVGGVTVAQPDGVTCAATGLLLLNAACDPTLAAWLESGDRLPVVPPELAALSTSELAEPDPARRVALAAAAVHDRATRATIGPFRWPRRYGTPPWGVAREARVPGVRYRHRAVDDRDERVMDEVLDMLVSATSRGVPVPIYSGGDWSGGWQTAMPRHLVLALPTTRPDQLRIYEPGRGRIETIAPHELRARTTPHRALGDWTHLAWTLIPVVR
ncbi:hypothetical protein [Pseudactinotalea suaedae]|uniref:hypothetical protein n=1 Tax=Pseudactinotalea suaedae TaxID=1524924 RepID=UPI0012E157C3|nr:hypothetical protein [Pseudactinotalea suaedae]